MSRQTTLLALVFALASCDDKGSSSDDDSVDTHAPDTADTSETGDTQDTAEPVDNDNDGHDATTDCNDENADIHPGADELCNGVDDDCDEEVDEDPVDLGTWYADLDGDGYGDPTSAAQACEPPAEHVADNTDCDDALAEVNPGADEVCNGRDDDCDPEIDEDPIDGDIFYDDLDGDGFGAPGSDHLACEGVSNDVDCNDADDTEPQVVDAAASGPGTGSLLDPWTTIQEGIDNAAACVAVLPGTYSENLDYGGANLHVFGVDGADWTVLEGPLTDAPIVSFTSGETSGARLSGFTLRAGVGHLESTSEVIDCGSTATCVDYYSVWCGGGVYVDGADPTLSDLVFVDNLLPQASATPSGDDTWYTYSYGGAICALETNLTLEGVQVQGNTADQGAGLFLGASAIVTATRSVFADNDAYTEGGGIQVDAGTLVLENSVVATNSATTTAGGLQMLGGSLTMVNAAVVGDENGGLVATDSADIVINSSIFYDAASGYGISSDGTATFAITYSTVYGNADGDYSGLTDPTGTDGNLSEDPLFTTWDSDDNYDDTLTLQASSPCVDAGDPDAAMNDVDGSQNDMGAYGGPGGGW